MWIFLLAVALAAVRAVLLLRDPQPRAWQWWLGWGVPLVALVVAAVTAQDLAVQKLIGRLVMPFGLLWLGAWLVTGWQALQRRRRPALISLGVALAFSVLGSEPLADGLLKRLEHQHPPIPLASAGPFEAVFVCGGGTAVQPDGRAELGASGDRLLVAATLWHHQRTPLLIASSSSIAGLGATRDLASETADIWQECGIPQNAIISLPGPRNTSEEILRYQAEATARHWTRVAVVSSAWHLPRIAGLCQRAGFAPTLIGADYHDEGFTSWALLLVPTGNGASSLQTALWEELGALVRR